MLYMLSNKLIIATIAIAYFSSTLVFYIWLYNRKISIRLKYNVASVLCFLPIVLNFGFFRMIFSPLLVLFALAFLLINNFCCKYLTPQAQLINRITYITYAFHNILLPDTNIRGHNYILGGLIEHQFTVADPEITVFPPLYFFTEWLIYFFYYLSAILFIASIVLLIIQLILCITEKRKIKKTHKNAVA